MRGSFPLLPCLSWAPATRDCSYIAIDYVCSTSPPTTWKHMCSLRVRKKWENIYNEWEWTRLFIINISLSLSDFLSHAVEPMNQIRLKHFFWSHFQNHFDPDDSCSFHVICPCSKCHLKSPTFSVYTPSNSSWCVFSLYLAILVIVFFGGCQQDLLATPHGGFISVSSPLCFPCMCLTSM